MNEVHDKIILEADTKIKDLLNEIREKDQRIADLSAGVELLKLQFNAIKEQLEEMRVQ